jgi:hypothetical protein
VTEPHVYTVASGFGLRVVPVAAPYYFARGPVPQELDIGRRVGVKELFARLTPDHGGYTSKVAEGTRALADVVDVVRGPAFDCWWLETTLYRIPLPEGWQAVVEGDPKQPSVFDLWGPDGALIFVQTPRILPAPDRLCLPGQRVHARGDNAKSSWVELRYARDGGAWVQRHDVVQGLRLVVTVQVRAESFAAVASTHEAIVSAIAPTPDAG